MNHEAVTTFLNTIVDDEDNYTTVIFSNPQKHSVTGFLRMANANTEDGDSMYEVNHTTLSQKVIIEDRVQFPAAAVLVASVTSEDEYTITLEVN